MGRTYKVVIKPVSIIQKGVLCAMLGKKRRTTISDLFHFMNVLELEHVNNFLTYTFVYRFLQNPLPDFLLYGAYRITTRVQKMLPFQILGFSRQGILFRWPSLYIAIPFHIRSMGCHDSFKVMIKNFILDKDFLLTYTHSCQERFLNRIVLLNKVTVIYLSVSGAYS